MRADTTLYAALALIAFAVLFGTRHIDNTERHEGPAAAIAFESVVKLGAFCWSGPTWSEPQRRLRRHLHARRRAPELAKLMRFDAIGGGYAGWSDADAAVVACAFIPAAPVPGAGGREHRAPPAHRELGPSAVSGLINLFVLPALAGLMTFRAHGLDADLFVLDLPIHGRPFPRRAGVRRRAVGGDQHGHRRDRGVVDDGLQRPGDAAAAAPAMPGRAARPLRAALGIRRIAIAGIVLLGLPVLPGDRRVLHAGVDRPVSFAACAQFAPVIPPASTGVGATPPRCLLGAVGRLRGLERTRCCCRRRALRLAARGLLSTDGPFGIELLKPYAVRIRWTTSTHALVWAGSLTSAACCPARWGPPSCAGARAGQPVRRCLGQQHCLAAVARHRRHPRSCVVTLVARLGPGACRQRSRWLRRAAASKLGRWPPRRGRAVHFAEHLPAGAIGAARHG